LKQTADRFPDFVRYAVQQLKPVCPAMGKAKMVQTLCRAGLHLGKTTVGRILKEKPVPPAAVAASEAPAGDEEPVERIVKANYTNHVWTTDLTIVPILGGLWALWFPFSLPQVWPFCWWVAVVVDHYSRRIMGLMIYRTQPTARAVQNFLDRTIQQNSKPRYIVTDKGSQFWCSSFKDWCKATGIKPRFGAVGKYGSIAVVERFMRTLKDECTRVIRVPARRRDFRAELSLFAEWFNEHRPHIFLNGKTPAFADRHASRGVGCAPIVVR